MKKPRVGIFLGILAIMLTGCSALSGGGAWAAKVNGEAILVKDFEARVAAAQRSYEGMGANFNRTFEEGKRNYAILQSQTLSSMVQAELIAQEVARQGLDLEDPKVIEREDEMKSDLTEEEFQEMLVQQGMTETDLKNIFALIEKITEVVKPGSEEETRAFFDENADRYGMPESVSARHILVTTKEEAEEIIAELEAGADFAELARERSIEGIAYETGGDLGEFTRGMMVPAFEEAAFAQEVGVISAEPVETEFGYHVILVEAHNRAVTADYEEIRDQVVEDALNYNKNMVVQEFFADLFDNAEIEYAKEYAPAA